MSRFAGGRVPWFKGPDGLSQYGVLSAGHAGADQTDWRDDVLTRDQVMSSGGGFVFRPIEWGVAAVAAFLIAGLIVLLFPAGSDGDPEPVIAAAPDQSVVPEAGSEPEPEVVPEEDVKRVRTTTIRVEPEPEIVPPAVINVDELGLGSFSLTDQRIPGGCGMLLERADTPDAFVFFNTLASEGQASTGYVILANSLVTVTRTDAVGDPMGFGQFAGQTFASRDGATTVEVTVSAGPTDPDGESVPITEGTLIITGADGRTQLPVRGDMGC
ncbi:MAG: hypothetical protein AAF638_12805 [Pseudomonadota bacterium]